MTLITINAVLGVFFFGYTLGVLNNAQKAINHAYGIDHDTESKKALLTGILNASAFLGAGFGAISTGFLLHLLKRRSCLMICDIIGICGCLFFLYPNIWVASVGRFISGYSYLFYSILN